MADSHVTGGTASERATRVKQGQRDFHAAMLPPPGTFLMRIAACTCLARP